MFGSWEDGYLVGCGRFVVMKMIGGEGNVFCDDDDGRTIAKV